MFEDSLFKKNLQVQLAAKSTVYIEGGADFCVTAVLIVKLAIFLKSQHCNHYIQQIEYRAEFQNFYWAP